MMMTLINKEQLLDAVMKKSYSQASIQLINDQPEVKAIPIEWIAKQAIDTDEQGAFTTAYLMLIEKWREDNGK